MYEGTYLHQNLRHQQQMSRAVWMVINNAITPVHTSDTYYSTKATEAIGFGWRCLLDSNLLWRRRLTWRAHIRVIWLRWR
jgi:hypothetical protein